MYNIENVMMHNKLKQNTYAGLMFTIGIAYTVALMILLHAVFHDGYHDDL